MPLTIQPTATLEWRTVLLDSDAVGSEECGSAGSDCCDGGSGSQGSQGSGGADPVPVIDYEMVEYGVCFPEVCVSVPSSLCVRIAHSLIPGGSTIVEGVGNEALLGWEFSWGDGVNSITGRIACQGTPPDNTCGGTWCDQFGFNGATSFGGAGIAYQCCIYENQNTTKFRCDPFFVEIELSSGVTLTAWIPPCDTVPSYP